MTSSVVQRRTAHYTPPEVAGVLADWVLAGRPRRVLEPGAGEGALLRALADRLGSRTEELQVTAVDLDAAALHRARESLEGRAPTLKVTWHVGDFFRLWPRLLAGPGFDAILSNPPFLRFQDLPGDSQHAARSALARAGVRLPRQVNVWAVFLALALPLLRTGGRLALVLPLEFLRVQYGRMLRETLARRFRRVVLVVLPERVFPRAMQGTLLLLASGWGQDGEPAGIRTVWLDPSKGRDLGNLLSEASPPSPAPPDVPSWSLYLLPEEERMALLEAVRHPGVRPLGDLLSVDIGVLTGADAFFLLTREQRRNLRAWKHTVPVVPSPKAVPGLLFRPSDFRAWAASRPAFLLHITEPEALLPRPLREYLKQGASRGLPERPKLRGRRPWYRVPGVWPSEAFLTPLVHRRPRLVAGEMSAVCTTSLLRVRRRAAAPPLPRMALAFQNSLTLAWMEVLGRMRGGGGLELRPREAEALPLPLPPEDGGPDLALLDRWLRQGRETEVQEAVDRWLLVEHLGLPRDLLSLLRRARARMMALRMALRRKAEPKRRGTSMTLPIPGVYSG